MNPQPLTCPPHTILSVVVITYNAALTVIETLTSIQQQTYGTGNIELIISDDASNDNTVDKVSVWLKENHSPFHSTQLLISPHNQGTVKNCNTAWRQARGEWIKTIAGDDVLLPHCLAANWAQAQQHPEVAVLFSLMKVFYVNAQGEKIFTGCAPPAYQQKILRHASLSAQRHYLHYGDIEAAPSAFINREKLIAIGYADERMRLIEDLPLWYKFVMAGYRLHLFAEKTVMYRVSDHSVTRTRRQLANLQFIDDLRNIDAHLIIPELKRTAWLLRMRKHLWPKAALWVIGLFNNQYSRRAKMFYSAVLLLKPNGVKKKWVQIAEKLTALFGKP